MDIGLRREWCGEWTADFLADMTMSDYGNTAGVVDATKGGQNAHTHHIKLTTQTITWDMDGCPAFSPATTTGFQFSGTVSLIRGMDATPPSRRTHLHRRCKFVSQEATRFRIRTSRSCSADPQ